MDPALAPLLDLQSGVVSRSQALGLGLDPHDLRRLVRRRELVRLSDGVFLDHTGRPTWLQRAWGAVLHTTPSVLHGDSAIRASHGPGRTGSDDSVIHVAIARDRTLQAPDGVMLHRVSRLEEIAMWHTSPPRARIEPTLIGVAAAARTEIEAIAILADAVQARLTTAVRLREALDECQRIPRRAFLAAVLDDVATGACSALEVGHLRRVERAHGLPDASRQVRASARGPLFRDVVHRAYGLVVELDGRHFHDSARARHRDLDRDLAAAVEGLRTVRIGWAQVFGTPCLTASRIGMLLAEGGWQGSWRNCPTC